ncbi:hypothetical protein Emtol_3886 [Emticicia oligotrophica DSM 17448]|uniref:Uncharacterized protein n=1 Tax=Emticicia oligotrophica (strain DSM 17448 / CIP 109782 / MTCC 6937 / GPTSA100-15) TaxID=929562 RepID=A0ABM5N6F4_EMTOG|nr:hypothetical protein [Emticicia oligotrophica]AFK05012.1 hypothetical protein Emtol_3886 [Emticicia oligotrophica DSM 17448]
MNRIFSLLFILLTTNFTFAQKLTNQQLENILNNLQEKQFISEFGKDAFLKVVNNEDKMLNQRIYNSQLAGIRNLPDSLIKSNTGILGFIGIFELLRNVGSSADEMIQIKERAEKMLGERMFFKTEIEGNINVNNPLTFIGLSQNLKVSKESYTLMANELKNIGLINENVYKDLIKWLEKDQIKLIKDFGFFIYAAKQNYFYENYESLKNEQLKFINNLQEKGLLEKEDAEKISQSYQTFELKSNIDILSSCKNVILVSNEAPNLTREEIYLQLFTQIKEKLLPSLNFQNFKLEEVKTNESQDDLLVESLPMASALGKDKKNYRLSFNINGSSYSQKANTNFTLLNTIRKSIPPELDIDSSIINTYIHVFSFVSGLTNKDFQSINDYLIDQHSAKRVFVVNNEYNPFISRIEKRKAIILIDSTQFKIFTQKNGINEFLGKLSNIELDFSAKNSRDSIYAIINVWQKNGLVIQPEPSKIEKIINEIRLEPKLSKNLKRSLFIGFPENSTTINFNLQKEIDQIVIFKNFIAELSRISNDVFKPEKITDNFSSEIPKGNKKDRLLKYGFKFKGVKYENHQELPKLEINDSEELNLQQQKLLESYKSISFNKTDWLNLVNQSLEDSKIDGKFYTITNSNSTFSLNKNTSVYVYLTDKNYAFIKTYYPEILEEKIPNSAYGEYKQQIANFNVETLAGALKREKMVVEQMNFDLKNSKEPSDILKESNQVVVIDMNELTKKSDTELYNYILSKLSKSILPNTEFTNLSYQKENKDSNQANYLVSLNINGQQYQERLFVSLENSVKSSLDSLNKLDSNYFPSISETQFKIINDYLTDINSPNRLVIVCDYHSPKLSFVLFDSTQANIVEEALPNNFVDFSMYNRKFSRDSLKSLLDEIVDLELIPKITQNQKESYILKIRQFPPSDLSIFENLKDVIGQCEIWGIDSYKNVFKSCMDTLSKISRFGFSPIKIEDNFSKMLKKSNYSDRIFTYSFKMPNGKLYSEKQFVNGLKKPKERKNKIAFELFNFDTNKLIQLINKALAENNVDGLFYTIYMEEDEYDDTAGPKYIFLNTKQHRWMKNKFPDIFEVYSEGFDSEIDENHEK